MRMRRIEEYDLAKLREARRLVVEVNDYYYSSANSGDICNRMVTIEKKLDELIKMGEEYKK